MDARAARADLLRQTGLKRCLAILVSHFDTPLAACMRLRQFIEARRDRRQVRCREQLLSVQHMSVRN